MPEREKASGVPVACRAERRFWLKVLEGSNPLLEKCACQRFLLRSNVQPTFVSACVRTEMFAHTGEMPSSKVVIDNPSSRRFRLLRTNGQRPAAFSYERDCERIRLAVTVMIMTVPHISACEPGDGLLRSSEETRHAISNCTPCSFVH
jgi:hypothetical protein